MPLGRAAVLLGGMLPAVAPAQEPRYAEWRLVETAAETAAYRTALRSGGFDDDARGYLRTIALPQLAVPANRLMIDRVRRRLRDVACDPGGEPRAVEQAGQVVADFMKEVAADEKADAAVRVNAMLLVGELNAKDGRPLAAALAALLATAGDARQLPGVRIAAATGIARHVQAAGGKVPPPAVAAVVRLAADPGGPDPVASEWLASRALGMLANLGPDVPQDAVAAAAALLGDAARAADARVRAAAVIGAAGAAGIDVAPAVAAIRDIAVATLQEEATRDEPLDLAGLGNAAAYGGGMAPGFPGAGETDGQLPPQTQACRRAAWRLDTLATALAGADGEGGLAARAGPTQAQARELAVTLREAARNIDEAPDVISIRDALDVLAPAAAGPAAAPAANAAEAADAEAAPAGGEPPASPFGP